MGDFLKENKFRNNNKWCANKFEINSRLRIKTVSYASKYFNS